MVFAIDARLGVVRRPSCGVLEPADGADAAVFAEGEPMRGAAGNAQQIAGADFNGDDLPCEIQEEDAAAGGGEGSLVEAAGGDEDAAVDAHAEVAAGGGNPSVGVAPARGGAKGFGDGFERGRIGGHA